MNEEIEERRPLVEREPSSSTLPENTIKQPRFKYIIEPILFIASVIGFPRLILDPLLLYYYIAQDIRGNRTNLNISQLQTSDACHVNTSDPLFQYRQEIQQHAAIYTIYLNLAVSIPAFFIALFLGAYSDKAGRKFSLIPPVVGDTTGVILTIFVIAFRLPTWVLVFCSFLVGCGGNYQTFLLGCFSYVVDTTEAKDRAFRITVVEMIMFGCGIFSYVGIGYWIASVGFLWPYVAILIGKILIIFLLVFVVPETVIKDPNASFFSVEHLKATVIVIKSKGYPGRRWKLLLLMFALFLPTTVILGANVDTLFEMNIPMCWNSKQLGIYGGIYIATVALGGIIGAKVLKMFLSDVKMAMLAGMSAIMMSIYKSFIFVPWMMYLVPALGLLSGIFIPTLRAVMSNLVQEREQGSLFGAIACIEITCGIVGASMFNVIYSSTVSFMRGFVFLVFAIFYASGVLLLFIYIYCRKREDKRRIAVEYTTIQ